jgi:hypothetical protein
MNDADLHREEWISERAAIREYDGGMARQQAEVMARLDWQKRQQEATCTATGDKSTTSSR